MNKREREREDGKIGRGGVRGDLVDGNSRRSQYGSGAWGKGWR